MAILDLLVLEPQPPGGEFNSAGGIGNVYQVTYKDSTSYSGSGRGSSDVVAGLNATFTRQSQTSKTILSYSIFVGSTSDCWIMFKIQYSTDGSNFTDVPDVSNQFNAQVPRGHFGNANRGGGSNGTDYETSNIDYVLDGDINIFIRRYLLLNMEN